MFLMVKVIPGARRSEVEGWQGDVLKVRIKAPPDKGKANDELIALLAKTFEISKSEVDIVFGHTSRLKRVSIQGKEVESRLAKLREIL